MKMVGTDDVEVERVLRAGLLECDCGGCLRPWGGPVSEVSDGRAAARTAVARRALHHLFENHPRRRTEVPAQLRCIGPGGHRTTGWFSRHQLPPTRLARRTGARRCRSTPTRVTPNGARAST